MKNARTTWSVGFLLLLAGIVAGCGGGSTTLPGGGAAPSTGFTTASGAVASNTTSSLTIPSLNGISGTLSVVTGSTWPSGVTATISSASTGTPVPQSDARSTLATAQAAWSLTFAGSTATAPVSSASFTFTGIANPASLVVELFNATAGGAPLKFPYNASTNSYNSTTQQQIVLSNSFFFELVSGSAS